MRKAKYIPKAAAKIATPPASKTANNQAVVAKIISEFQDRNRAEIRKWRQALTLATNPDTPRMYILQDLYDNLESDGHYIAQRNLRKAATLANNFSIQLKADGNEIPEKTELFKEQWFIDFVDYALDSVFKGFTLLELQDPSKMRFELIPRRNTIGAKNLVLFEAGGDKGIDVSVGFEKTIVRIGKPKSLGVLADLCGQLIWKRNAQQSWAEYSEKYGQPLITATTNKTNQGDIDKIDSMLMALGEAARAVLPEGTTLKVEAFSGSDAYKVYDMQIERINGEIAKPITGGTMLTDNGSSQSQAVVHERNLDDKIAWMDKRMIEFVVNDQLLPIMAAWGWNINPETDRFVYEENNDLSLKELWDIVDGLSDKYELDEKWLSKKFNIPILGVKKVENKPTAQGGGSIFANFQ